MVTKPRPADPIGIFSNISHDIMTSPSKQNTRLVMKLDNYSILSRFNQQHSWPPISRISLKFELFFVWEYLEINSQNFTYFLYKCVCIIILFDFVKRLCRILKVLHFFYGSAFSCLMPYIRPNPNSSIEISLLTFKDNSYSHDRHYFLRFSLCFSRPLLYQGPNECDASTGTTEKYSYFIDNKVILFFFFEWIFFSEKVFFPFCS